MKKEKCKIGETHFISPPRPCAPNLWTDKDLGFDKYKGPSFILDANLKWN